MQRTDETQPPLRVVAIGGGTGMPAVLRGLKACRRDAAEATLTAVVTMTDDGGSSGRLRATMGVPPPGDVRNCLVALSDEGQDELASLFQHRYRSSGELKGHPVGNLILAALAEQTGCFLKAVEVSSKFLRTAGRILPVTRAPVTLEAELEGGARIRGETRISSSERKIVRVLLRPRGVAPTPGVIEAILAADLVVLGPGSLFTSVVPSLVVRGVGEALQRTRAAVVLVANLVSERGEASGLDLPEHIRVVEDHAGFPIVDGVLVNDGPIGRDVLARYDAEGAKPLSWPRGVGHRAVVLTRDLLADSVKLRHDPAATALGLTELWTALTTRAVVDRVS